MNPRPPLKPERGAWCVRGAYKALRNTHHALRNNRGHLTLSILLPSIFLLLAVTACGGTPTEPAPPTIHYGEDICEFCGMIVTEERFAAAYVTSDGHGHVFDDIGDMVQSHLENPEDVTAFFVHDYESKEWIRAETAYFVQSGDLSTPMVSGLAAFASADKADEFANQWAGDVMTFEELLTFYRESPPTPFLSGLAQAGLRRHGETIFVNEVSCVLLYDNFLRGLPHHG